MASTPIYPSDGVPTESGREHRERSAGRVLVVVLTLWLVSAPLLLVWWERPIAGPSDEIAHVVFFAVLTLTGMGVASNRWRMRISLAVVGGGALVLAVATEVAQAWLVPGRAGSLNDTALNLVGIALGVGSFWAIRTLAGSQARAALASVSAFVLVVTGVVGLSTSIGESTWWRCRGADSTMLSTSQIGISPGPVVEIDGGRRLWRWHDGQGPAHESAPQTAAFSAWCSMLASQEFTVVAVIRSDTLRSDVSTMVLGTPAGGDRDRFNFELIAQASSMTFRYRTGESLRFPSFGVREIAPQGEFLTFIVRRSSGGMSVFIDGRQRVSFDSSLSLSWWSTGAELMSAMNEGPSGDPVYAALFARALSDEEASAARLPILDDERLEGQ